MTVVIAAPHEEKQKMHTEVDIDVVMHGCIRSLRTVEDGDRRVQREERKKIVHRKPRRYAEATVAL